MDDMEYSQPSSLAYDGNNSGIKAALRFLGRSALIHNRKEGEWRMIQDLFESQFVVRNPSGTKKISSKVLLGILWWLVNKMKPLDFKVHLVGGTDETESIVSDGISTIMDEGGFGRVFRDKGGIGITMLLFGDFVGQVGTMGDNGPWPIQYRGCQLSDVYVDNDSTDFRDPVGGLSSNEAVAIYRYSVDQFAQYYPAFKNKISIGEIPRAYRLRKPLNKKWEQVYYGESQIIEVAHYWNVAKRRYTVFAGGNLGIIKDIKKTNYPYVFDGIDENSGIPYLPLFHFKCFPATEGWYNYGIGHALYDLIVFMSKIDNMAFSHGEDNVYPINIVNVPRGESGKFFKKLLQATKQRQAGGKGYAVMEVDGSTGMRSGTSIESFQSAPITEEWERLYNRFEQSITRLGIPLDPIYQDQNTTATQVYAAESNSDQTVKQIMEFNTSESKFIVDATIDIMKKTVSPKDKTPLNLKTKLDFEGQPLKVENITMGAVVEELIKKRCWVSMDSRSGSIPSNTMQQYENKEVLSFLPPGSPAQGKAIVKAAKVFGHDIDPKDLGIAPPQGQPGQAPPQGVPANAGAPNALPASPAQNVAAAGTLTATDIPARTFGAATNQEPVPAF